MHQTTTTPTSRIESTPSCSEMETLGEFKGQHTLE